MNDYVTEDEQVERIKQWWKDNGSSVIFGLVIGIGGLAGWRFWVDYRDNINAEASVHFEDMIQAVEQKKSQTATDEGFKILDDYASTSYAELAHLTLAKVFVEENKFGKAAQQLQALLDSKPDMAMEMLTRERLAAVLQQQDKLDQAMALLEIDYPKSFAAAFEERKGNILAAQGNKEAAKKAYQKAQLSNPQPANPQFLREKMDDLGIAGMKS